MKSQTLFQRIATSIVQHGMNPFHLPRILIMAQEDFRFEAPPTDPVPRKLIEGHEKHMAQMENAQTKWMFNEHHRKIYG